MDGSPLMVAQVGKWWGAFRLPWEGINANKSKLSAPPVLLGWGVTEQEADLVARQHSECLDVSGTADGKARELHLERGRKSMHGSSAT